MTTILRPEHGTKTSVQGKALFFERGLIGYPEWQHFVLTPLTTGPAGVQTLRCVDPGGPTFLVVDPRRLKPDYRVKLSASDLRALQIADPNEAILLSLLSVQDHGGVTTNLLGPLVINPRLGLGRQVVMCTSTLSARCSVSEEGRA